MSSPALALTPEDEADLQAEFVKEIAKQIRAIDTYDTYQGWSDAQVLDPLILTKERKREIPIIGDPDDITISRVKAFYNSIASLIEKKTKLMAVPVINLTHEGFGRAFVIVGKLIVVDKTLRDVHRYGFPSFAKLNEEGEKAISNALELIEAHREVADL
jgi:probable nitrogen fixation protein